jgi:hypothetical protein
VHHNNTSLSGNIVASECGRIMIAWTTRDDALHSPKAKEIARIKPVMRERGKPE